MIANDKSLSALSRPNVKSIAFDGINSLKSIKIGNQTLDDILNAMAQFPEGARIEIAITWKDKSNGHVFVAEKKNGEVNFYDVQSGEKISQKVFEKVQSDETRFWRIDNLDPSDRGITACEAGE